MEKNALLPIKFYPAISWADYNKTKNYSGKPGISLLKSHHLYCPAFQMTMPDVAPHWGTLDFTTFEMINYDTGAVSNMLAPADQFYKDPVVYNKAGDFRALVNFRFPTNPVAPGTHAVGRYYYHISDGQTHWYSEVFEICDLGLSAWDAGFANDTNFAAWSESGITVERSFITFCKATGSGIAEAYTEIEAFLGEEFDFFIRTEDTGLGGACAGLVTWNDPVYFELRDTTGLIVSNVVSVDTGETAYTFTLTAQSGGTLRLYMWMANLADSQGIMLIWLQRRYTSGHVQLRYSNDKNFCKIFYEDDYENVFFIDSKQVIDQQVLDENVVEDDQANKYPIIATNQKWNSLQFASGEAMLNAMSLFRIHDNRKIIRETGEIMDIVEVFMEQSVLDYEAALIKLVYREASCSNEACGFDDCCPTLETPIMQNVYSGVGALPAPGAGNNGWYAMVWTAADQHRIYLSNGAAWAVTTAFDVADDCVEARQNTQANHMQRFFWFDTGGAVNRWRIFIDLVSVTDNADGTGDLNTDTEYRDGLTVRGEYEDANGDWHECTDQVDLVAGGGAIALTTFSSIPGVGTWDFRLHIWTDDCDYGYSNVITQTIT